MHFDIWLLIFAKGTVSNEACIIGKVGETSADFLDGEQRKLFKTEGIRSVMKLFSGVDLVIYFFIYGLLAWILNTVIYSLKEQKYINTGELNVPILGCPALIMVLMIIVSSGRNVSYYGILMMAFIDCFILDKVGLSFRKDFF